MRFVGVVAPLFFVAVLLWKKPSPEHPTRNNASGKIYCMVPTIWSNEKKRKLSAIAETWGPKCDILKFFVDDDLEGQIPDRFPGTNFEIVRLQMVRRNGSTAGVDGKAIRHIVEKMVKSWRYIFENDLETAEWFLKVDDDTYLIPENLVKWIQFTGWKPTEPHYFGHKLFSGDTRPNFISGVCTVLSRAAVEKLGTRLKTIKVEYGPRSNFPNSHGQCIERDGATEELVISKCLSEVGVFAKEATEGGTKEIVLPLGLPFSLIYKRKLNSTGKLGFETRRIM